MQTFADLPDALVRDLLAATDEVATTVSENLQSIRGARSQMRQQAQGSRLICRKADLDVVREPSVAGVDGSYQIHRLTSADLCAAAAVAVEGTAKEARRHWPEPYHEMWVGSLPHGIDTVGVLRGLMVSMEMALASQAPHDLVLLDGSFASLIIYLNQALTRLNQSSPSVAEAFLARWDSGILTKLLHLLQSDRTVAMPKFTSRNELVREGSVSPPTAVDGKTLATVILEPGEYTVPLPIHSSDDPEGLRVDHLPRQYCSEGALNELLGALYGLRVIYFRPYGWLPAMRMEVPQAIATSPTRMALVLEGITRQLFSPAVIEPYPLFLADRMVKSLGAGVAVVEQAVAQHVVGASPDVETTLLCLQNYRTEGGRGGV